MNIIARILKSKKAIYAIIPVAANAVVLTFGYDPTSMLMLVLDAAFGWLTFIQGMLDLRFGSASDGTKKSS